MRFIKRVYHVNKYVQDGTVMEGKAPDAPFLGSNYDGSFIAGVAQLRYLYSLEAGVMSSTRLLHCHPILLLKHTENSCRTDGNRQKN